MSMVVSSTRGVGAVTRINAMTINTYPVLPDEYGGLVHAWVGAVTRINAMTINTYPVLPDEYGGLVHAWVGAVILVALHEEGADVHQQGVDVRHGQPQTLTQTFSQLEGLVSENKVCPI